MKKGIKKGFASGLVAVFLVCAFFCVSLSAAPSNNAKYKIDDAKAFVNNAMDYIRTNGKDASYKEFTEGSKFKKGDVYIFVFDSKCNMLAHGGNKAMVGKNFRDLKDPTGHKFVSEMVDNALRNGQSTTNYIWSNPLTKKPERKTSYAVKFDGDTVVGCGVYEKNNGK